MPPGVEGFMASPASFPRELYRAQGLDEILRLVRLDVDGQHVRALVAKARGETPRRLDHQVDVEKQVRALAQALYDREAQRDVRHELAVHDVYMQPIRPCGGNLVDLAAELCKVGREDRGSYFYHRHTSVTAYRPAA